MTMSYKTKFTKLIAFALLFLGSLLITGTVSAAPADPEYLILTQPDGYTFVAQQWGDEHLNGFVTETNHVIRQEGDWWVYSENLPQIDGSAIQSVNTLFVGQVSTEGLPTRDQMVSTEIREQSIVSGVNALPIQYQGNQPVIVILASFSDRKGTYPASTFQQTVFGNGKSVVDYFRVASFGKLNLVPAAETHGTVNDGVIGWIDLGYNHPNPQYSINSANQKITVDALTLANEYIDYAQFDSNNDGVITSNELHIIIVVAGYETATSGTLTPGVWGHNWSVNINPPVLDGVRLVDGNKRGSYSQVGEIHRDHPATIGAIVHELGHDINWPDLYDTGVPSWDGVGYWSVMGHGLWNSLPGEYRGMTPALPDAFLKYYQGWIDPVVIDPASVNAAMLQANASATNPIAYLIGSNPGGVDWIFFRQSGVGKYFLVENRQPVSYDAALPGSGLAVWHIDETVVYNNFANDNADKPLVQLVEADGRNDLKTLNDFNAGDSTDLFGSAEGLTQLLAIGPVNTLFNDGNPSGIELTNISMSAPTMAANLNVVKYAYAFIPSLIIN